MLEWIVLGLIQGLTEWLPVSSEGMVVLAQNWFWPGQVGLRDTIEISLWLHLGTWLAAVVYFRREIWRLSVSLFRFRGAEVADRKLIVFLVVSTLISGALGFGLLELVGIYEEQVLASGRVVMGLVGGLLLVTGWLQLKTRRGIVPDGDFSRAATQGVRNDKTLILSDGVWLGIAQGLAALPGFSRSGLTVTTLLWRKFDKEMALRLSFLMSIPIVLAGNILLNGGMLAGGSELTGAMAGLMAAFVSGWLTIHWFLIIARRVNFGWFVVGMGVLSLLAAVVG